MKTRKRLTALLLSCVLLIALAVVPVSADAGHIHEDHDHVHEAAASAVSVKNGGMPNVYYSSYPGQGENHTHDFSKRASKLMYYCQFQGEAEVTYDECSCGAKRFVKAHKGTTDVTTVSGQCTTVTVETASECSAHPMKYTFCTSCQLYYGFGTGGHVYDQPGGIVQPTCTQSGYEYTECSCGATHQTKYLSATGHKWENYSGFVCGTGKKCSVCGATEGGRDAHVYEDFYRYNDNIHYHQCRYCGIFN